MKNFFLALLAVALMLPAIASAQPLITLSDTRPTSSMTCPPDGFAGCTSATFTVPVTGDYVIDSWIRCPNTPCQSCVSCVTIHSMTGAQLYKCSVGCPGSDCNESCRVSLPAGTYTIDVCLLQCVTGTTPCDERCQAWGCVRPPTTPPCY